MHEPAKTRRGRRPGCVLVLVGALLVVGGLGYLLWTWLVAPKPSDQPLDSSAINSSCSWPRKYFPDQPVYEGSEPHPVAVLIEEHSASGSYYRKMLLLPSSVSDRTPGYLNPRDDSTVQLLACLDQTEEGRQVKTCEFDSGEPVPMRQATYEVTVYEARTGDEVGKTSIRDAVRATCPTIITYRENEDPKLYTEPSLTQVEQALTAFTRAPE